MPAPSGPPQSMKPPILPSGQARQNMANIRARTPAPAKPIPAERTTPLPTEGRFRKKPVIIRAFRLVAGTNPPNWFLQYVNNGTATISTTTDPTTGVTTRAAAIKTTEGTMTANNGDWILAGVNGEVYPCKDDVFEKTYDFVGVGP